MGKNSHRKKRSFKIIHKDCGHGARSKVSIVKRKSDGKLLIWKQPLLDDKWHHESLRKEIKYSKFWRKFGVSRVKACWHSDGRSLLKTYIKGITLGKILKEDPEFFSKKSIQLKALKEFLGYLIDSKHYVYDLIADNLVFDGKRWNIIDSGSARYRDSRSAVKKEYKEELLISWSRELSSDQEVNALKEFLDSARPLKYRR